MFIKKMNGEELIQLLFDKGYPVLPLQYNGRYFEGWRYFSPFDIQATHEFLIVFSGDFDFAQNIIGVLKFGLYHKGTTDEHYGINYVTVRESFKHTGVARKLINAFNELDLNGTMVFCSEFSDYAMQVGFNKIVEAGLNNHTVLYDFKYIIHKGSQDKEYVR